MKIGRISRFLMFAGTSLFLHTAALSVIGHFIPRGRPPAAREENINNYPIELYHAQSEKLASAFKPKIAMHQVEHLMIQKLSDQTGRIAESTPVTSNVYPEPSPEAAATHNPDNIRSVRLLAPRFRRIVRRTKPLLDEQQERRARIGAALGVDFESPVSMYEQLQEQRRRNLGIEIGLSTLPSGEIPRSHTLPPADQPSTPECREVGGGFACRMVDPTIARHLGTAEHLSEREYEFARQENGDLIYRDPDRHNEFIIHPDGTMEDNRANMSPMDGILPWDIPKIPHYMWRDAENATAEARLSLAEQNERSLTGEALNNLSQELSEIIERHTEWPLAQQHDFLFRRWDECREDSVGNEARTTIEEFIRQHYPQGSPMGITAAELRGFNDRRRTESQSFCPYGCLPGLSLEEPQVGESL